MNGSAPRKDKRPWQSDDIFPPTERDEETERVAEQYRILEKFRRMAAAQKTKREKVDA